MDEEYTLPSLEENPVTSKGNAAEEEYQLPKLDRDGNIAPNYADMPWSEVAGRAYENFPKSAEENLMAIPNMIRHPVDTMHGIGELGGGLLSKAKGLVSQQDPEQKKRDERVLDATLEPFTSMEGFKKTLAEDPVSVTSALAAPFTGGTSLGFKGANIASRAANAAGRGARYLADPAAAALEIGGDAAKHGFGASKLASKTTGLPKEVLDTAYDVHAAPSTPENISNRQYFNDFMEGRGDPNLMSESARTALSKITKQAHDEWKQSKEWLMGRANHPVDHRYISEALDKAESDIGDRRWLYDDEKPAFDRLDAIRGKLADRMADPKSGLAVDQVDAWKRSLWNARREASGNEKAVIDTAHAGVRDALQAQVPEYVKLMEGYQYLKDDLQNVMKTLGTSDKTAASREMAMLMRQFGNDNGRAMIQRLAEHSPELPYMIAGALASSLTKKSQSNLLTKAIDSGAALFGLHGMFNEKSLIPAIVGGAASVASHGVQSPSAAIEAAKLAGTVARPFRAGAKVVSENTPEAVKKGVKVAKKAVSPAATNLQRGQFDVQFNEGQNRGGRIGRRAGGRIVRALTAEQLISGLERARNRQKKKTEPILNKTDEAVVRALHIANQHI